MFVLYIVEGVVSRVVFTLEAMHLGKSGCAAPTVQIYNFTTHVNVIFILLDRVQWSAYIVWVAPSVIVQQLRRWSAI